MKSLKQLISESFKFKINRHTAIDTKFNDILVLFKNIHITSDNILYPQKDDIPFNHINNSSLRRRVAEIFNERKVYLLYNSRLCKQDEYIDAWNNAINIVNKYESSEEFKVLLQEWDKGYDPKQYIIIDNFDDITILFANSDYANDSYVLIGYKNL